MASFSIAVTAEQAQRVSAAYGDFLGLGRDATLAEVKAALIAEVRSVVRAYETRAAIAAVAAPTDVEPT